MHSRKVLLGDASHFCILFTYCEGLKLKCDRYSSLAFNFRNNSANRLTLKVSLVPKQYSNLTCDKRCMKPSQSCSCVHENLNVKNMHMDLTIDGMPCQNWSCFQVIFYFEPHASCKAVLKTAGLEMGRTQRGILVDRLAEINAMPLNEFNPLSPTFWLSGKQMHCDAGRVTCILAAFLVWRSGRTISSSSLL